MKLIIGLGNPGRKYKKTRHNIGFMFLDSFASDNDIKFKLDTSLKAELASIDIENEKVILAKPQTFMNLSGEAVRLIINYYKIDIKNVLVIHDDLDLEVGTIRFRSHGSSAGHKGMQNIMDLLDTQDIKRLKVGIGKPVFDSTIDYVLGTFDKQEMKLLNEYINNANNMIRDYCLLDFEQLMSRYNN